MPKLILEFNLPEETEEYEIVHNANRYHCALFDILNEFRAKRKYSENQNTTWDDASDLIYRVLRENKVEL